MAKEEMIEREVISVLQTLMPRGSVIRRDQTIIGDLKLLCDDASAIALDLQRKFAVTIPGASGELSILCRT